MKSIPRRAQHGYTQLSFFDLPGQNALRTYICNVCGKEYIMPYKTEKRCCSRKCHSIGRTQIITRPCLSCGKEMTFKGNVDKIYCSPQCRNKHLNKTLPRNHASNWTPEQLAYLRECYPTDGSVAVAEVLGKTPTQVVQKANRLKIPLNKEATKRIVNAEAQKYMLAHNPMKTEPVKQKMKVWRTTENAQEVYRKMVAGQARIQRDKPSKYEFRVRAALDELGIVYESSFVIKEKFIVDIKIGNLIIEADGDYWHGHPRFEPLTERQLQQQQRDEARNKYLLACGYQLERIWESDFSMEYLKAILHKHDIYSSDVSADELSAEEPS